MIQGVYTAGDDPLVLGTVYRVRPQLLDPNIWLFRVSTLPIESLAVYDAGEELIEHSDLEYNMPISLWYPTEIEITNHSYTRQLTRGLFRLSSAPRGQILCDVTAPVERAWTWVPNQAIADALRRNIS